MQTNYIIFFFSFLNAYRSSQSITIALTISISIWLGFYLCSVIWRSSQSNKLLKAIFIIFAWGCIAGVYCLGLHGIAYYSAQKKVGQAFTTEEIQTLKDQYEAQKEIDLDSQIIEIQDRLNNPSTDQNPIQIMLAEMQNIDTLLANPFILNYSDSSRVTHLKVLRKELMELLIEACKDNPELLKPLKSIDAVNKIMLECYGDPVKTESYKILIEQGPIHYWKFFEDLVLNGDSVKLKKLLRAQKMELQRLDIVINKQLEFEALAIDYLNFISAKVNDFGDNFDAEKYIKEKFPNLLHSIDGRKKIISDLSQLYEVLDIYIDTIRKYVAENKNSKLKADQIKALIYSQTSAQVKAIVDSIYNGTSNE